MVTLIKNINELRKAFAEYNDVNKKMREEIDEKGIQKYLKDKYEKKVVSDS